MRNATTRWADMASKVLDKVREEALKTYAPSDERNSLRYFKGNKERMIRRRKG